MTVALVPSRAERASLTPTERLDLAALADIVAPAVDGMPSAGEVALLAPGGPVDRVLAVRPQLLPRIRPALGVEPTDAGLDALAAMDPATFEALLELVVGAYTLAPAVRAKLGYRGQEALSLDRGRIGAEDELLLMMERPPFWRDAGDGTP